MRSRLYLTDSDTEPSENADPNQRILTTKKANYGPRGESIDLEWQNGVFVPLGITDRSIKANEAEKSFLNCLDALEGQNRKVSESKNSSSYAPKIMVRMPEAGKCRRPDLERAMNCLFSAGKITNEDSGPPSKRSAHLVRVKVEEGG